ncbi:DUF402 domain-containing protein [Catenulispora pinisilvae]|uniref:DUF402 domain-containing protein n=1 Tax=Catenulispora pinisilvae TaxID=2705253 RepID=UPI001891385C|nr:DUF402 domain-containing protein [Catenulispora pinisilvae]
MNIPLKPGSKVTVRLLKAPRPDVEYPAVVRSDDGEHLAVVAPWFGDEPRDMVLAGEVFARFEPGDLWTEHYWRSRWYSIKEVRTAAGELKGWYCDVARPATAFPDAPEGPRLEVADLDLDLWLSADHTRILRLDEDEFEDSGLREREPETAARAEAALDELAAMAHRGGFAELLA